MSTSFYETREWTMGDSAQKDWARRVAKSGKVVLPTYGMDDVDASTKAPVLFCDEGLLVAPDMLVMKGGKSVWHEVKAKAVPTWRKFKPGPRWEHGIDFSILQEYQDVEVQSGSPVWFIVFEEASPADPARESKLSGQPSWLAITLQDAVRHGERRPTWPGGASNPSRRGRRGEGGWLWPRAAMSIRSSK